MTETANTRPRHLAWIGVLVASLAVFLLAGFVSAAPAFPVKYSTNQRYLVDQNGVPFPIMGRTAWFLTSLSVLDYQNFVDDTVARGYSAIEFHVVNHDPRGNHPPFNGNGDLPFLKRLDGGDWSGVLYPNYGNINLEAPDLTTPNEAYWSFVDALLAYCESKGLLVFMFPAYVGAGGGEQGWMQEMVVNGPTKMQSYGAWIAERYKNQKNLVWMAGGDMMRFDSSQTAVENALITGLKSVPNQRSTLFSAEWERNSIATDHVDFGSQMTLNGTYANSQQINYLGWRAYTSQPCTYAVACESKPPAPTMPAYLLEQPFDEEGDDGTHANPDATQPVRRFQWWGWLSTIGGYISGNGYVWPFTSGWQLHLDSPGTQDMARLNAFIRSIAWYNLVPSVPSGVGGGRTLITAGVSCCTHPEPTGVMMDPDYVAAAATPDGTLLVAYIPPAHSGSITVDMTALGGPARARWFDPTSGAYSDAVIGLVANTGTHAFTPPGANSAGENDWVLVLQFGARLDFDFDGKSDILWRHTDGTNYVWNVDGASISGGVVQIGSQGLLPGVSEPGWSVAGIGDFNGDGKADILWRHTSGINYVWMLDGANISSGVLAISSQGLLPTVDASWIVASIGDFNGDGKSDILWRRNDGINYVWHIDGSIISGGVLTISSQGLLPTVDTTWSVAGVGNFDGDGKADILWRRNDGTNYVWHVNGASISGGLLAIASQGLLPSVTDLNWSVVAVGDYNGDGKSDVLWRHSNGTNYVWHVDGAVINAGVISISSQGLLPSVTDMNWSVVGSGDHNGDGKSDVLWRHTNGTNYIWHINGAVINGGVLSISSQGLLPGVTDAGWQVQNPK